MPVLVVSNEIAHSVKRSMATDRHKEVVNVSSDSRHQYNPFTTNNPSFNSHPNEPNYFHPLSGVMPRSRVHPTPLGTRSPHLSISFTLQLNPSPSPVTDYQDPGASRVQPQQSREYNKKFTPASVSGDPAPSRRSASIRKAARLRYSCKDCGKRYVQSQGLRRHRNEAHESELCIYCLAFQWGRRYILKKHLQDKHPDLNIDVALEVAMETRRGAASTSRRSCHSP
jgi:ribosomal protein L44E